MSPKILTVDIETAPNLAYVWGFWKQNIGHNQVREYGYIMSYSAKWLGEDEIIYNENRHDDDKPLVSELLDLFNKADVVIAHNAKKFDIPTILGRGIIHGLKPPSPFKVIDTLQVAKSRFRFPRNTLEYIAEALGCAPKLKHGKFAGFELWYQCLKQNEEAWDEMREYNIQDVLTLEEVYLKMRPWIPNHPNVGIYTSEERPVCPKCGGHHIHWRGYYSTNLSRFHRFQCKDCGGWGRARTNTLGKDKRNSLGTNAL